MLKEFSDYDWPGNIRELKNEIERLIISTANGEMTNPQLLLEMVIKLKNGKIKKDPVSLFDEVAEFEKKRIIQALKEANGMKNKAASVLNIPVNTLLYKIKKYNLDASL